MKFGDLVKYVDGVSPMRGVVIKVDGELVKVGWENGNVTFCVMDVLVKL